ncbi:FadR/GntR family transcriptional regulator [Nocardioides acrostichi]|uniref:FadR family transcriptional regulator n=1 Tax=Nocardioides acrostichi TaxID=2784339 RepID=A0A930Y984_9ACTN|nr:FCD domain-containing protein [Nocardioides acrostichi]MBF4163851.1 FadR family transcriptional regulator [Nocardioides acrostichi]
MTNTSPNGRHGDVVDALGAAVVAGDPPAGSVLTLDLVGERYDVSRSVAREAVRVLESMGLVASRRRVGITVQPRLSWHVFDPRVIRWRLRSGDRAAQLLSLSELRRGIEPEAAALAARRATSGHCRDLAAAASDMAVHGRTGDLRSYLDADRAFHRTLLEASGNEMMRALHGLVEEVLAGRTQHGMMPARPNPAAIALHDDVARAVRLGQPDVAESAMRAIIDEAAHALRAEHGE